MPRAIKAKNTHCTAAQRSEQYFATVKAKTVIFQPSEARWQGVQNCRGNFLIRLQKLKNQIASHWNCFLALGLSRGLVS